MTNTQTPAPPPPYKVVPFGSRPDVTIVISHAELAKYKYLTQQVSPNEVQWYSKVKRIVIDVDKRDRKTVPLYVYKISDMFIPEQTVSGTEVDTDALKDPLQIYRMMQEIQARHADDSEAGYDDKAFNEDIASMHVWCHTHPFSKDPKPSGTDDKQFSTWIESNQISHGIDTPMVALIFGNSDKIHARVYEPRSPGAFYDEVTVNIQYDNIDTEYMDHAIETKIKKKPSTSVIWTGHTTRWHNHPNSNRHQVGFQPKKIEKTEEPETTFFSSRYQRGNWESLLMKANLSYSNEEEVTEIWNFVCQWLPTDAEKTLFAWAMTDTPESLFKMTDVGLSNEETFDNETCLMIMVSHFDSDTIDSYHLKHCLTFAKRFCAAKDKAARTKAVQALKDKLATKQKPALVLWDENGEYETKDSHAEADASERSL
jgi:hypothetical protein